VHNSCYFLKTETYDEELQGQDAKYEKKVP